MTPRHLFRSLACVLPLLVLSLLSPDAAFSQSETPVATDLAPEARTRLTQAAEDTRLAPWQHDLMLRLARRGGAATTDSSASDVPVALPAHASGVEDGAWNALVSLARQGHSAIYDPVRDRMVVFGGHDASWAYRNDVWTLSLAGMPVWTKLEPMGPPPGGRRGHTAIYDPVRDRMVVFGGAGGSGYVNDVWALSLAGTPAWTQLTPTGTPPSERGYHSAIYDPVRDRIVVFGGVSGSYLNDVWALSLTGTPAWTEMTATETPPGARGFHSAIYDPVRDRMVVSGGYYFDSEGHYLTDVWELSLADTPSWMQLTPAGTPPSARYEHSAIYDPVRDRMLVFGGYGASGYRNDIWALSLADTPTWTGLTPAGTPPSARRLHSAIYDPVRDRMVVFGGYGASGFPSDLWTLSLVDSPAWTRSLLGVLPSVWAYHSAIYDPVRDRMVIFGGEDGSSSRSDVWSLSLPGAPSWTQLTPSHTPPSARFLHSAIYDPVRDRMVVFGGCDYDCFNDVWTLSLTGTPVWTRSTPSGTPPSARLAHSAVYDPVRDRMVVFGGADGSGLRSDVWSLSLSGTPSWTQLTPSGTPPGARCVHSAIYDPVRDRMVVFGGSSATGDLNDVWELSLPGAPAWTELTPVGTPPIARYSHSAIYDPVRDRMVLFGGWTGTANLGDVWALPLAGTPAWSQLTPSGTPPSGRDALSAIYDPVRDRMVIFGGEDGSGFRNDAWALGWSSTTAVGDPQMLPLVSGLRPPVPNPARGATTVSYSLAHAGRVQLGVYDVSGRLVRRLVDGERGAGTEAAVWNGTDESGTRLGAGVYFVRLAGPGLRETRRVILLR